MSAPTAAAPRAATRILSFDVGLRHLAYAVLSVSDAAEGVGGAPGRQLALDRWGVLDIAAAAEEERRRSRGTPASDALTTALVTVLDREFYDPGAVSYDHVLIENQPSRKNPSMKAIQVAIHTYFATLRLYAGCVGQVRLVSATQKLLPMATAASAAPSPSAAPPAVLLAGAAYRERKARSIEMCRRFLAEDLRDEAASAQLAAARKKDDLCDALLQAVWFVSTLSEGEVPKKGVRAPGKGSKK